MPMEMNNGLIVSESDYRKLAHLVEVSRSTATYDLDVELAKADICPDDSLPETVVALYDTVVFRDLKTDARRTVTIVMPWESSVARMHISILSPVGTALIGEPLGATITWPLLNGRSAQLQVVEIKRRHHPGT
ncbi:regulator of nucleoside diphosphate kinase [Litorivivens lipolytica]|uniref:Regulator of nucleoside diphosphate kinase n=1 Tax=Litorivivens lipolytica TaxID=1524264 RepID=A0A7W4W6B6_9GAMM|nr:GreA/GreB family elongation factor [Litorivivens lipolytica]MBB3048276.1 regulator of nucleoside diphosphate kinase [Litorivivens lipolytica]